MPETPPGSHPDLESLIPRLRDLRRAKNQAVREIEEERDRLHRQQQVLAELTDHLERRWWLHLQTLLSEREKMAVVANDLAPFWEALSAACSAEGRRTMTQFPRLFERALADGGLPIDLDSRHPQYTFDDHFIEVRIFETGKARISDREGHLLDIPADPGAVVQAVQKEHARLFNRPFNGPEILNRIRRHYLAVLTQQGEQDGASVPIRKLTARMGKNIKGFRTDEFLIDLSRLVAQGPLTIDGMTLDLQHTKDTHQGVLLHGPAGRGYIGFVLFRKEQS